MGLVLKCLFQFCCDVEEDNAESYEPSLSSSPNNTTMPASSAVSHRSMSRGNLLDSQQPYQIAPQGSRDEEEEHNEAGRAGLFRSGPCCGGGSNEDQQQQNDGNTGLSLHEFFRRLRDRWRMYDSLETVDHPLAMESPNDATSLIKKKLSLPPPPSPLRQASSFDSSRDIPVISKDEVVLPGSDLQKEMAKWQSKTLEGQGDECVICMEGFDSTNPRMPTICGCGENKTYFHLPCLYQWIEQSRECPSCRQRLTWEEF